MEHRGSVRYKLAAPAVFSWGAQEGDRVLEKGATRDISAAGAFILAAVCPPADVSVRVEIFLPLFEPAGHCLRLTAEGRVARVEHRGVCEVQDGFAVVSEGFDIPELAGPPERFGYRKFLGSQP